MWILSPLFMYQKGNQRAMKKACRDALEWGCRDFDWEIFADVYGFQICSRIAGTFLPGAGSIPGHGRKERRGRAVRFGCQEDVPWTTKMLVRGVVLVWEVGKLNKKQVSWDLSDHKILSCFALSTNTLLFSAFAWNPRNLMLQGPFFFVRNSQKRLTAEWRLMMTSRCNVDWCRSKATPHGDPCPTYVTASWTYFVWGLNYAPSRAKEKFQ